MSDSTIDIDRKDERENKIKKIDNILCNHFTENDFKLLYENLKLMINEFELLPNNRGYRIQIANIPDDVLDFMESYTQQKIDQMKNERDAIST